MLSELQLELNIAKDKIGLYQSSNLQGVLMESISPEYAQYLHSCEWNPYSQHIEVGDKIIWHVKTLTKEAYENIIAPLLSPEFSEFKIEKKDLNVQIVNKQVTTKPIKSLLTDFYETPMSNYLSIDFFTPTAFKQDGHYVIIPDLRLMYQSLMNKFSHVSSDINMLDNDTLQQLVDNSYISRYKLLTKKFPLEGINISGYVGSYTIKFIGPETLRRYVRLLCEYGEYSGVGIKSAIGMGAMKIWRKNYDSKSN